MRNAVLRIRATRHGSVSGERGANAAGAFVTLGIFAMLALPSATPAQETLSLEEARAGIVKSVQAQFDACNEENMEKLLSVVSQEVPSRRRLITEVDSCWSVNDSYNILESVEILDDSDAPGAEFEYPYATARVTQTVLELRHNDERKPVFLRKCRNGDRDPLEIATHLGLLSRAETSSVEVLFKHEDGEWKLVNGLTEPVLAGKSAGADRGTGIGVPAQRPIKVSGSVFH